MSIPEQQLQNPAIAKSPAPKKKAAPATKKIASNNTKTSAKKAETSAPAKKTTKSVTSKKKSVPSAVKIIFQLRFSTNFGQSIYITGQHPKLGGGDISKALPLQYFNDEFWYVVTEWQANEIPLEPLSYKYVVKNQDGSETMDWGNDKAISSELFQQEESLVLDSWNHAGYYENAFYTEPFLKVLLKKKAATKKVKSNPKATHVFRVKAPLLHEGQSLCLLGSDELLGAWKTELAIPMELSDNHLYYELALDLSKAVFPCSYKYGVRDEKSNQWLQFEGGDNRVLYDRVGKNKKTFLQDGFAILPNQGFRASGVAIPVFSLRTQNGWGVGEFADIPKLVDWCSSMGIKLIQLLPVNDTIATHTYLDSYPYSAISAFALHPMYLNLEVATHKKHSDLLKEFLPKKAALNAQDAVDYNGVVALKMDYLKALYPLQKEAVFASQAYNEFFSQNEKWLVPYAVYSYLKEHYKTPEFSKWPDNQVCTEGLLKQMTKSASKEFNEVAFYFFTQYLLHEQLKEAANYAHLHGVIMKGDIPIGISRNSADAWQEPELYHMDTQAGAPPDDFAVKGQNWGFPTYNWHKMRENGFEWWKQRFGQMSHYFDAFRIDHILGFFRIWTIPLDAVQGILGRFVPAIPIDVQELYHRGIHLPIERLVRPFITDSILWDLFADNQDFVKSTFLTNLGDGVYQMKPAFSTQRAVEEYFIENDLINSKSDIKEGLFDLISNIILIEEPGQEGRKFHFRISMESTSSFRYLDVGTQHQLKELYVDYYFRRQDDFWRTEAMLKLPALKQVTNMLICGEDLGMVPDCVPDVMRQLGLLSLEIQRMPKDPKRTFFHPNDAPYLSVVTPSTHDMSTIRGWWEEDRQKTQQFFNFELGQWGEAPAFCEDWINKGIVMQHLYSPAMWAIFQMQDLMGMDAKLRRENPNDERINVPANPKHYWQYRMHISLEDLMQENDFNNQLKQLIQDSGRA